MNSAFELNKCWHVRRTIQRDHYFLKYQSDWITAKIFHTFYEVFYGVQNPVDFEMNMFNHKFLK